jgi:hypothetical protein
LLWIEKLLILCLLWVSKFLNIIFLI